MLVFLYEHFYFQNWYNFFFFVTIGYPAQDCRGTRYLSGKTAHVSTNCYYETDSWCCFKLNKQTKFHVSIVHRNNNCCNYLNGQGKNFQWSRNADKNDYHFCNVLTSKTSCKLFCPLYCRVVVQQLAKER